MIVTSKRCLFNVLFQILPLDQMLNANYYVLDAVSQNSLDGYKNRNEMPEITYDEYGNFVAKHTQTNSSLTSYHINYGRKELDPTPFKTKLITGACHTNDDVMQMFVGYLKNPETLNSVYEFLFEHKPKGNGLQILLIYDDDIVVNFAHTICQYLSYEFGCDINFVDPIYRPNVSGNKNYNGNFNYLGNKERGQVLISNLQDNKLLMSFNGCILQNQGQQGGSDQVKVHLRTYDTDQLMRFYNLLFPDMPLPPGYYEHEHLMEIIISKTIDTVPQEAFGRNLYTSTAICDLLDSYEQYGHEDYAPDVYDYMV